MNPAQNEMPSDRKDAVQPLSGRISPAQREFPSDPADCVTDVEVAFYFVPHLHRFLARPVEAIKSHTAICPKCSQVLARAERQLRGMQSGLRRLAGGPSLPHISPAQISSPNVYRQVVLSGSDQAATAEMPENVPCASAGAVPPACAIVDARSNNEQMAQIVPRVSESENVSPRVDHLLPVGTSTTQSHINNMDEPQKIEDRQTRVMNFALDQMKREVDDKALAALWVAEETPLGNGSGLLIDAGSQCFKGYEALAGRIDRAHFAHLKVITSNQLVLESWGKNYANAQSWIPHLEIMGGTFDAAHLAFYGGDKSRLAGFRPAVVLIGVSGIEFEPSSIRIGCHAGEHELNAKKLLFQSSAKRRFIFATPSKIGDAGCTSLDLLSEMEEMDETSAPLYLVTAEPGKGTAYESAFAHAKGIMRSLPMVTKLRERKLVLHWVTVKGVANGKPEAEIETFPSKNT